jgi:hypothetical protein
MGDMCWYTDSQGKQMVVKILNTKSLNADDVKEEFEYTIEVPRREIIVHGCQLTPFETEDAEPSAPPSEETPRTHFQTEKYTHTQTQEFHHRGVQNV